MSEEMVDIELNLGKVCADEISKMTKTKLINRLVVSVLRGRVQDETVTDLEREVENLQERLNKARDNIKQAEAMVIAAMERW